MFKTMRKYSNIPVMVVEYHNDVLRFIYKAIASRHLPFSDVPMLHLDAHPDLGIPLEMSADTVYNKEELLQSLDIENWILPAVYAGHIERLAWIKPPWSSQLPEGSSCITVGQSQNSQTIGVDSSVDYFLFDGSYVPIEELINGKALHLTVLTLTAAKEQECSSHMQQLADLIGSRPFILDIDLDFFSTQNPFRGEYSQKQTDILEQLFHYTPPADTTPESLIKCTRLRSRQLCELRALFTSFQNNGMPNESGSDDKTSLLKDLIADLECQGQSVDYDLLHNAGLVAGDTELPHHISTSHEIDEMVSAVERMLCDLSRPTLITVARSSKDEYCPKHQVDDIQQKVMAMIRRVYGHVDVEYEYQTGDS